jgi:hypothetical protein
MIRHTDRVSRIVVVGDLHGDVQKAIASCALAGVCSPSGRWRADVPAGTVVVQLGDQIDAAPRLPESRRPSGRMTGGGRVVHSCRDAVRGDLEVIAFFDELDRAARGNGCRVYSLLGNHEMSNAAGRTDYADVCNKCAAIRQVEFAAGGEFARHLAKTRAACLVVGGVLFAHAGICRRHLPHLDEACAAAAAYLEARETPAQLRLLERDVVGPSGFMCHRDYHPTSPDRVPSNAEVADVLRATGCNAMALGHNAHDVNGGVTALNNSRVWVVDPGLSSSIFDAPPCAVEILVDSDGTLTVRTIRQFK